METILYQMEEMKDRLSAVIYFGKHYCNDSSWEIKLEYQEAGKKIEIKREGATFATALESAWEEFSQLARRGIPRAFAPAIEHKPMDEEIPF